MVPGNHESKEQLEVLQKHYNVHLIGNNPVKVHEDLAIFGSNYISIGEFSIPEQEIFENLIENYEAVKDIKCKIHLSHIPPTETQIGDSSQFFPLD